ncbi:MAG: ribosome silencing factor [Flavobacteriaceae bacterium]|nr:ribosome silencing factor [Flavobacteriaceae bacterium]
MRNKITDPNLLITEIISGIEIVKGEKINLLDLRKIENSICDYYIVCNGNSNTHVNSIANSIQKIVSKKIHEKPFNTEGISNGEWVLMDYIDVVVHVFQTHIREYYNLEALWADAITTKIDSNY